MSVERYRPLFGRILAVAVWACCVAALVAQLIAQASGAPRLLPWLALVSLSVWALYWRPLLSVDDAGVHLINVVRTIDVPWPAIQRIDTKWALTLFTGYGKFTAWAAPAPGMRRSAMLHKQRSEVPKSAVIAGRVRPGDLPGSPSGDAAISVRRHWEQLQAAGFLDDPQLEFERAPVTWHWFTIGAVVVLVALSVLTLLI